MNPRSNATISVSTMFDRSTLDLRENNFGGFGTIGRGAKAGHRLPGHGLAWTVASRRSHRHTETAAAACSTISRTNPPIVSRIVSSAP